jgi:hypothetical protein
MKMKSELPAARPKTTHERDLIASARRLVQAQLKRRTLRRQLAETDGIIRLTRKQIRALLAAAMNGDAQLPPRFAKYAGKKGKTS